MEDAQIVELYWQRDEAALRETDARYGTFCRAVALNLLGIRQDAEECVNDTYLAAWNAMPTQRPRALRAWLGRVVRNIAVDRWRRAHAEKRYGGVTLLLDELEECVPDPETVERTAEAEELGQYISAWLRTLPEADRVLFVRRYWNGEALNALARARGVPPEKLAQRMYRLRQGLRAALEKEGIGV